MTPNPLQSLQSMWSGENTRFAQGLMAPLLVVAILALMVGERPGCQDEERHVRLERQEPLGHP